MCGGYIAQQAQKRLRNHYNHHNRILVEVITEYLLKSYQPDHSCYIVEYHATMESCSDKFHVDIPNVV
jgi:hypothetical protein